MKKALLMCVFLTSLYACREPFVLDSISFTPTLVVEGQITNELKKHRVVLSYTTPVDAPGDFPETGADVRITDGDNQEIILTENVLGTYETPVMAGVTGQSYVLTIATSGGKRYRSETVIQKPVAEIDSVTARFMLNDDLLEGVQFFVNGHTDNPEVSPYYRWEWTETYEINTPFPSRYDWVGGRMPVLRTEQVGNCWPTVENSDITVKSASDFSENRVAGVPIRFIQNGSPKLRSKYSLLVRQFSLDNNAFTYWRAINDLLSGQGSLADIQPGNLTGNVFDESGNRILGYFDASEVASYRIFIEPEDFEDQGLVVNNLLFTCGQTKIVIPTDSLAAFFQSVGRGAYVIQDVVDAGPNNPAGWQLVRKKCGDCTDSGTNIRPDFWE